MSRVTPIQARDFYRATATFYRQAPLRSVGGDEPIKIPCEQLEGSPRFAIILGKKGKVKGVWLCDYWETCFLFEQVEYQTFAEQLRYTALHFGDRTEPSPNGLEMAERHGFEIAGPRALPVVFRKEPGGDFRKPDAREPELLEACLGIIPISSSGPRTASPTCMNMPSRRPTARWPWICPGCRTSGVEGAHVLCGMSPAVR
jgi:hypothetical protein